MPMTNLYCNPHRLSQLRHRDQIDSVRPQRPRIEFRVLTDDNLPGVTLDLQHVQRGSGSDSQALALTNRKIVNAGMLADYAPIGSHHFSRSFQWRLTLLG